MTPGGRSGHWPVRCAPLGAVAVGSVLWRHRGELRCTAVVKATFALGEAGEMARQNPQPIRRGDDYLSGRPSLAGASEIAPRIPRPEVVVVGHAYVHGPPAARRSIRLTVVRGQKIVMDKTLFIYGKRLRGQAPQPFTRMRIGYEGALGGLTCPQNPIGVGLDDDSSRLPSIIDPRDPERRVAGLGPYPALFPRRRRLRGKIPLELIEGGIADYPDDFDFRYFQTAPSDQHLERLRGDEWIFLEGLHPRLERVRARLPRATAFARIYGRRPHGVPDLVPLTADLLHVEPNDDRCSLCWRGNFALPNEHAAEGLIIAGAVQLADRPVAWPADLEALAGFASPSARGTLGAPEGDLEPTVYRGGPQHRGHAIGYRQDGERVELAEPPRIGDTVQPPPLPSEIFVPNFRAPALPRFDSTEMMLADDDVEVLVEADLEKTDPLPEDFSETGDRRG